MQYSVTYLNYWTVPWPTHQPELMPFLSLTSTRSKMLADDLDRAVPMFQPSRASLDETTHIYTSWPPSVTPLASSAPEIYHNPQPSSRSMACSISFGTPERSHQLKLCPVPAAHALLIQIYSRPHTWRYLARIPACAHTKVSVACPRGLCFIINKIISLYIPRHSPYQQQSPRPYHHCSVSVVANSKSRNNRWFASDMVQPASIRVWNLLSNIWTKINTILVQKRTWKTGRTSTIRIRTSSLPPARHQVQTRLSKPAS
jgi:hypothetical protein